MITLFARILFILCLCVVCRKAASQEITFLMSTNKSSETREVVFEYFPSGHTIHIGNYTINIETQGDITIMEFPSEVVTIVSKREYWHTDPHIPRMYAVISSSGDIGYHKVYYGGESDGNKRYIEEIWQNGRLIFVIRSLLDQENKLIWSITTNTEDYKVTSLVRK